MNNDANHTMKLDLGDLGQISGGGNGTGSSTLGTTVSVKKAYCKKCAGKLTMVAESVRIGGGNTSLFICTSECPEQGKIKNNEEVNWL